MGKNDLILFTFDNSFVGHQFDKFCNQISDTNLNKNDITPYLIY